MKVAVVNWTDRKVGGAETYIAEVIPLLLEAGDLVGFWCQTTQPPDRQSITPIGVPVWSVDQLGLARAVEAMKGWGPDLLYVHGLTTSEAEAALDGIAPIVFYAHGYYGTCISGAKTRHQPEITICTKSYGPLCLAHFYPHRCGGLNPLTMISDYRLQKSRIERLRGYSRVLCASNHMRAEYLNNGVPRERVQLLPYPIDAPAGSETAGNGESPPAAGEAWRIVSAGRLEPQKGGEILLDSLPLAAAALDRPLELVLAGEGRDRARLERRAAGCMAGHPGIRVRFTGWVSAEDLYGEIRQAHLLAVPSVWPEPFGIIGVEAGHFGVPAAAFAVGGIPDWLEDGVNGMLAPAAPPTARGFADAVIRCLDPTVYPALRSAARASAQRFSATRHLGKLREILAEVHLSGSPPAAMAG